MTDSPRDRDAVLWEVAEALRDAEVLGDEYAGYDEDAARRRVARRVVADRIRALAARRRTRSTRTRRQLPAPPRSPSRPPPTGSCCWTRPATYAPYGPWTR